MFKKIALFLIFIGFSFGLRIRDIQFTNDPSGESPLNGQWVTVYGIVTAGTDRFGNKFFMADSTGAWNGIMVYAPGVHVKRSDSVKVHAKVQEYYGLTELNASLSGASVTVLGHRKNVPEPVKITASQAGEAYEGVLVFLTNVRVVNPDIGYGEWLVQDSLGNNLRIDDIADYYYEPELNDTFKVLRGVLYYSWGNFKLEPRGDFDLVMKERPIQSFFSHDYNPVNLDSLLIEKLKMAAFSIDIAIYSLSSWNLVNLLKDKFDHGVKIRVIVEHDNRNSQIQELEDYGIPVIDDAFGNNSGEESMHNKFFVLDFRDSTSKFDDFVITGSYNATYHPFSSANNFLLLKDFEVAKAYTTEFEEMWGSNTENPDLENSKFGENKSDNTQHVFNVGGKTVKVYFSPTDAPETQIESEISMAQNAIYFCIFQFTYQGISNAMKGKWDSGTVMIAGVFDSTGFLDENHYSESWDMLGLGGGNPWQPPAYVVPDSLKGVILHHKFMVIDPEFPQGHPAVITGSVNWTYSGFGRNDENLVIVEDSGIAREYFEEFQRRYTEASGNRWPPGYFSIYEIQENDPSDLQNMRVKTCGVVTGVFDNGRKFFVEEKPGGPFKGIFVYMGNNPVAELQRGDSVSIMGIVQEYYNLTELNLSGGGKVQILKINNELPEPILLKAEDVSELYEGVLVKIQNAMCVDSAAGYGEWVLEDSTGQVYVDDMGIHYIPEKGTFYEVVGPLYYSFGNFKIEPRDSEDIVVIARHGDINGDGMVNKTDIETLAGYLFFEGEIPDPDLRADMNFDGMIDPKDLVKLSKRVSR